MRSYKLHQILFSDIGYASLGDIRMLLGALTDDVFARDAVDGRSQMQVTFVGLCQLRNFNDMTVNLKSAIPFCLFESPCLEVGVQTVLDAANPFVSSATFSCEFAEAGD